MSHRVFVVALWAGLLIRVAALPLPGTGDVSVFKIWSHEAATGPVSAMYGVGGVPPERRLLEYDGRRTTVDYPPVALYEIGIAGLLYRTAVPAYPDTAALTACVKAVPVAAEVGIAWVLWMAVRRGLGLGHEAARYAVVAFWLNPAALVATPVLGYLDALFALPALAALVSACAGSAALAGCLMALAILTKPQAVFLAPVVGLALLSIPASARRLSSWGRVMAASGAGAVTAAVVLAPTVLAGAWPNFVQAMASFGRHDMLSGQAANAWWIVTYIMRAIYAIQDLGGALNAFLAPVRRPLAISTLVQLGYPNPRLAATLLVVATAAWGLWMGRRVRDVARLSLVGAWVYFVYFMVAVGVHENHFFMIVPLLALAAAALPEWRRPFWALSLLFALNLNLFYGFGDRIGFAMPRTITGLDATVWIAIANVALFVWCARLLTRTLRADPAATTT